MDTTPILSAPDRARRKRPVVVVFAMPFGGHFRAMRPLIAGLVESNFDVVVFADDRHASETLSLGSRFSDCFTRYPFGPVDPAAAPIPVRYVSYAGTYIDAILEDVRALDPALVVYEAYALIGQVVGRILELPYVAVSVWHDFRPDAARRMYEQDPRVATTSETDAAVAHLRDGYGLTDIDALSFAVALSPDLNIYCEPPEFLPADGVASFEPVAFYGSLLRDRNSETRPSSGKATQLYVSFGSYLWEAFRPDLTEAVEALVDAVAELGNVEAVVALGNETIDRATLRSFERPGVEVKAWADQRAELSRADVFVTHHGLLSTHEAIDQLVPMLSFPFFGDQPDQAAFCESLGLALPLGSRSRPPTGATLGAALEEIPARRDEFRTRLELARSWEQSVIARRPEVHGRILELIR